MKNFTRNGCGSRQGMIGEERRGEGKWRVLETFAWKLISPGTGVSPLCSLPPPSFQRKLVFHVLHFSYVIFDDTLSRKKRKQCLWTWYSMLLAPWQQKEIWNRAPLIDYFEVSLLNSQKENRLLNPTLVARLFLYTFTSFFVPNIAVI